MRLTIIANPVAGGGRAYGKIRRSLQRWEHPGWEPTLLPTRDRLDAGRLARQLLHDPPDLVAVCGGDGTINQVVSHLPDPPFPLAILPGGTANVMARELGLPLDPVQALRVALGMRVRRVDLGVLRRGADRRFLFVAGIGFDASAVARARPRLKSALGMGAYVVAVAECLRNYPFPEFEVTADTGTWRSTSCLVCNARSYGGGLHFCPEADMEDGLLDLLIIQGVHRAGLAVFLLQAWLGMAAGRDWILRVRTRSARIEGPAAVPVETDGELAGHLPLEAGLAPSGFPLVVPPGPDGF
ncbi:MAG: diacylglycerol kinase family lipid kinase [Acidobacteria bacterium]|nr:diacylglycerol kinase family lipid kinase [Acidobacteriota bacterium]